MSEWYYSDGDERKGPIPKDALLDLLRQGDVKPSDLVWTEGMPEWQPADSIPEFRIENRRPSADRQPEEDWAPKVDKPFNRLREGRQRDERSRAREEWNDRDDRDSRRDERRRGYGDRTERYHSYGDVRDDYSDERRSGRHYAPHRGGMILTFGILGIVLFFCVGFLSLGFAIPATIMGRNDLRSMDQRLMDPEGRGSTMGGFVCGIIGMILGLIYLLFICVYFGFVLVALAFAK